MSEAVIVHNLYKKFGQDHPNLWDRILHREPSNGNHDSPVKSDRDEMGSQESPAKTLPNPTNIGSNGNGRQKLVIAVNRISFTVKQGEIFGILGPNGGGKSTLIRLISTLLLPDDGSIQVFGFDVVRQPMEVQRIINRVSVEASFFKKLSPLENLLYGARLYGLEARDTRVQLIQILTRLGLDKRAITNPMEEMSRGMQQKVAIARALLTKPRLLLLDEPTTGLDPRSKREVQAIVMEMRQQNGTTILLTTHDMVEAETLCDRIAIMNSGNVVALDTPDQLKHAIPWKDGHAPTLEDVFIELTGKRLINKDEEEPVEV
jgi:ABC-2 type transport system ATP-binding protein